MQDASGTRTFDYTRHGNLKSETVTSGILAGQKIEQGFDSLLRTRTRTATFGAADLGTTTYGFGPSGAVQTVTGNGQSATYHIHDTQRVLERVTYTKDGETTPWLESTRKHDATNRLTRITTHVDDSGVQKAVDHHAYAYDALNRIDSHADMTGAAWTYGYNANGEVTKAAKKLPGGTTPVNGRAYRYHFDGIGNRTLVEQSRDSGQTDRSFGYTPDALNQYSAITHPSFVDVAGSAAPAPAANVTVNTASVTRQGGYFRKELSEDNASGPRWIDAAITDGTATTDGSLALPAASVTPQYDEDGNLKSDGLWTYTWDAENRLIRCERTAALVSAGAPYLKLQYDYDSQSRRIRTSTFTSSGSTTPASQTLFVFDGWKCVAELNALSGNQPIRKYTWGLDLAGDIGDSSTGNVGALLWLVDNATNKAHVHLYDKNGNVSGLVDATTRKRSATYDYDAFGQLTVCYGEYAKLNPFTYSTKHTDFSTGLCYYGYRWYSPMHGRWPSRDPIEEDGGINLYGFVWNNPLAWVDVLGLQGEELNCFYVYIKILIPHAKFGLDRAVPQHASFGMRKFGETGRVRLHGTRNDGIWKEEELFNPTEPDASKNVTQGGKQGKLYECCCLSDDEYKEIQSRFDNLHENKIPEGGSKGNPLLRTADGKGIIGNQFGVPYNCGTAVSTIIHGLGGCPTDNIWNMRPQDLAHNDADKFFDPVEEMYKQMENSTKMGKCKVVHNGVRSTNKYH